MFAALGSRVTIVESRPTMLDFCDDEIVEALRYHLRDLAVTFRFGETVEAVERRDNRTVTRLASGKQIAADAVFYSAGRQGATDGLDLDDLGIEVDERGRIAVDSDLPHDRRLDLRGRRRDRLSEPGVGVGGAGTGRRLRRARRRDARESPSCFRSASTPSPRSATSGRTEAELTERRRPVRGRRRALPRARPRRDPRRAARPAQAARLDRGRKPPRCPRVRNGRHRARPHRPDRDGPRRRPSTSSSTRSSTTRRSPRRTRSPR